MKEVDLFTDSRTPAGIRVFALGEEGERCSAIYPDWPSFLEDGRRFVVNTARGPAICDPDDGCRFKYVLSDYPDENSQPYYVDPSGQYLYLSRLNGDGGSASLTISRVDLTDLREEDVYHADSGKLPGTEISVDQFKLVTVSSDNQRVAGVSRISTEQNGGVKFGIFSLDLSSKQFNQVWQSPFFNNAHLRYSLSTEPEASHDLLVQMNHGSRFDQDGRCIVSLGPPPVGGMDIHVIRDDGGNRRDLPFGRDGVESCIGHQVWRGSDSHSVATISLQNPDNSYGWADGSNQEILAGEPRPVEMDAPHLGRLTPGDGQRQVLSQGFANPRFNHLACDASGRHFVFDTFPIFDGKRAGMQVYFGTADSLTAPLRLHYILNSGVTINKAKSGHFHAHPIISPDASFMLFNSWLEGVGKAYLVQGIRQFCKV